MLHVPMKLIMLSPCNLINSLAPGRSGCNFKSVIFNLILLIGILRSSNDNALRWMPQDFTDDKSILVQVMAWCRQATSHYLSQCWPRSMSPHGVIRPQWVKCHRQCSLKSMFFAKACHSFSTKPSPKAMLLKTLTLAPFWCNGPNITPTPG